MVFPLLDYLICPRHYELLVSYEHNLIAKSFYFVYNNKILPEAQIVLTRREFGFLFQI